jgi:hypothetical protein
MTVAKDTLALYEKLVGTLPDVPRKGDSIPYTSLNGRMFSFLSKSGRVALRLSPEDRDAFMKRYDARYAVNYGIVQKDFVDVPDALLARTAELKVYFRKSYDYAKSLKPKPTTRKKKVR